MKNFINTIVKSVAVVALLAAPVFNAQAGTKHQKVGIPIPPIVRPPFMQSTNDLSQFSLRPGINDTNSVRPGINDTYSVRPGVNNTNSVRPGVNNTNSLRPGANDTYSLRPGANSESIVIL